MHRIVAGRGAEFTSRLYVPGRTKPGGHTRIPWARGRGQDFVLQCRVRGLKDGDTVHLHSNRKNHREYGDDPMSLIGHEGDESVFEARIQIERLRAMRFAARIFSPGGRARWMSEDGVPDTVIRPYPREFRGLNIEEIQVDQVGDGTFQGLIDAPPEQYGLEFLVASGINCVWVMPPFETKPWEGRHPADDKGSPYATTDPFTIKRHLSRSARRIIEEGGDDPDGEHSRTAANEEFKRFVDAAHARGTKVILDVVVNHLGHNVDFRDRFKGAGPNGTAEVRHNDFGQAAISRDHLRVIEARLAEGAVPKFLEYLNTEFYAKLHPDGSVDHSGAKCLADMIPGGWGDWPDTKQLNHGARWGYGRAETQENWAVLGWLTRMLTFWAVDMDVDGFRFDNGDGPPEDFYSTCLNDLQAEVDEARPGKNLLYVAESFNHIRRNSEYVDRLQGGFFHDLLRARTVGALRAALDNDLNQDLLTGGIHDEPRVAAALGGNVPAITRFLALMPLLGGPSCRQMGDSHIEGQRSEFRSWGKVPVLRLLADRTLADVNIRAHELIARAGRAKISEPALQTEARTWLSRTDGSTDEKLLALARSSDDASHENVVVFANLDDHARRQAVFRLDQETIDRLDPARRYNVRNLMADDPTRHLWPEARSPKDLSDHGVYAELDPFEVQILVLDVLGD